jgi:hypothetical protein
LSRRLPTYHPSLTSGSLLDDIWFSFFWRWGRSDEYEMSSNHDFIQCRDLTPVALEHGAPIDECIDEKGSNLLKGFDLASEMRLAQRLHILQYFQWLGVDIEHRDIEGRTPLLAAIAYDDDDCPGLVLTYLKANANLRAVDDMGRGYLRIILERDGFLTGDSEHFNFLTQVNLLETLLSEDSRFKERAITPNETPRLIELAFSAVAWDVWTRVFEKLNWDMAEMNAYRYMTLRKPLPTYLDHYEEARLQMLGQTRFQLGVDKAREMEDIWHHWEEMEIMLDNLMDLRRRNRHRPMSGMSISPS